MIDIERYRNFVIFTTSILFRYIWNYMQVSCQTSKNIIDLFFRLDSIVYVIHKHKEKS